MTLDSCPVRTQHGGGEVQGADHLARERAEDLKEVVLVSTAHWSKT